MKKENLPMEVDYKDPEMLATIRNTVAKGTTDHEFRLFIGMCQSTGLNPLLKEIWCIKTKDQLTTMTGINGFYTVANNHPQYDGIETELIEEGGRLIKAIARVYRKDRSRPMIAEAYLEEYDKGYGNWRTMKRVMLSKCAESMALRKSFPQLLNGIYSEEEGHIVSVDGEVVNLRQEEKAVEIQKGQESQAEKERQAAAYQLQQRRRAWGELTVQAMKDGTAFQYMADSDEDKKALVQHCEEEGIAYYADRKEGCLWTVLEIPDAGMYCTHYPEQNINETNEPELFPAEALA